jgi:hypothetical protein
MPALPGTPCAVVFQAARSAGQRGGVAGAPPAARGRSPRVPGRVSRGSLRLGCARDATQTKRERTPVLRTEPRRCRAGVFGMIAATGIRPLAKVDFAKDRRNRLIVAVSVSLGMIPLVSDRFFQALPAGLSPLPGSGILLATVAAVLLNLLFNRPTRGADERPAAPRTIIAAAAAFTCGSGSGS